MLNPQTLYSIEDENVFSMSVPKNTFIQNENISDICDSDKNVPSVLLSPSLASKCKRSIQTNNNNNNSNNNNDNNNDMANVDKIETIQDDEWMFSLDDSIILPISRISKINMSNKAAESRGSSRSANTLSSAANFCVNTEESCYNYYNMAQQNYQLWLSSF